MARKKTSAPAPDDEIPQGEPLTPREMLFVSALLKGDSKQDAAVKAGFTETAAPWAASRMLQRTRVKSYLQAWYKREEDEIAIDRDRIRRRLLEMAMADPSEAFDNDWNLIPRDQVPISVRRLLATVKRWESDQGTSVSGRFNTPTDAAKAYLRFFPDAEKKSDDLSDIADQVETSLEELLRKLEAGPADSHGTDLT